MEAIHTPVLLQEVVNYLNCRPDGIYCDGTVGLGGHAEKILSITPPIAKLIGIDLDSMALMKARERLARFGERVILIKGNFKDLPSILKLNHLPPLDGVLLDLGLSSYQLEYEQRGFSFFDDAPLIMNFDIEGTGKAMDIVNQYSEKDLADIIWEYGQDRWSRQIARKIVKERAKQPIETAQHLARIICAAKHSLKKRWRLHPATKTFQALRIEINNELENLTEFLNVVWDCLVQGARVGIISYHSLEDALVKRHFRSLAGNKNILGRQGAVSIITKKPIRPSTEEIKRNPRSRSAKMRLAQWH